MSDWRSLASVTSRRRPNMRASSWPDISPFFKEITMPSPKKAVRTTAVPPS